MITDCHVMTVNWRCHESRHCCQSYLEYITSMTVRCCYETSVDGRENLSEAPSTPATTSQSNATSRTILSTKSNVALTLSLVWTELKTTGYQLNLFAALYTIQFQITNFSYH